MLTLLNFCGHGFLFQDTVSRDKIHQYEYYQIKKNRILVKFLHRYRYLELHDVLNFSDFKMVQYNFTALLLTEILVFFHFLPF